MILTQKAFHKFKIFVFAIYNLTYVLYMLGYMGRNINLALLFFFIILCFIEYLKKNQYCICCKSDLFLEEFKRAIVIVVTFFSISLIIQLIHNDFRSYLLNELLYNLIPPVLAFFWINTTENDEREKYFILIFLRITVYFILLNVNNFSLENIKAISWSNSKSSVFETTLAHDFLFLEIILLYLNKIGFAAIAMLFCILSFKRISFIFSILIMITYLLFHKTLFKSKIFKSKVNNIIITGLIIVFSIMPYILSWMLSPGGIAFFRSFGIDLNSFTTGRVNIIQYVVNNIEYFNGYGSSDYFMDNSNIKMYRLVGSMHCDMLKIYYEMTELAVIVFVYQMLKIIRKKWIIFAMGMYIFLELFASHFLDVLSVWNVFFMFAAFVYSKDNEKILEGIKEKK